MRGRLCGKRSRSCVRQCVSFASAVVLSRRAGTAFRRSSIQHRFGFDLHLQFRADQRRDAYQGRGRAVIAEVLLTHRVYPGPVPNVCQEDLYFDDVAGLPALGIHQEWLASMGHLEERGAIYFFTSTSSNRTSYYDPGWDRWPIESKLRLKYSHLIGQALENTVMAIKEAHQITMHSPDTNSLSRPHDRTFFMNFSFATFNCESLDEFLMRGLNLPALVLGFPSATEKWNACIVHHPLQNKSDAINLLYTTLHQSVDNNGPPSDDHNDPPQLHAVSGLQPQECELGFYIILYMMIGHKSNSFGQFNHAIQKAQEINDIGFRVRTWVHEIENRVKPKDYIPHWLEIICQQ